MTLLFLKWQNVDIIIIQDHAVCEVQPVIDGNQAFQLNFDIVVYTKLILQTIFFIKLYTADKCVLNKFPCHEICSASYYTSQ